MASRSLGDLLPAVCQTAMTWQDRIENRGVAVLVYCTYRSFAEQNELYALGRTKPGKVVTKAKGGRSWHQYRRAWDAVPIVSGKLLWDYSPDSQEWAALVETAAELGIEWAGNWKRFREENHFQITDGLTLAQAMLETLREGDNA